ncbi:MAG: tail fiber domain-containing protein [Bacteroidales bacterium]|nr:tail fiber domain-containing protein [Bacteroidales bacterium]
MKKRINLLMIIFMIIGSCLWAQIPDKFNYQAVIRDNSNDLVIDQDISLRVSIQDESETILYSETHTAHSNGYGVISFFIGDGVPVTNTFESIDWTVSSKFIKVEADIDGGTSYVDLGTSELVSVPYALHSLSASSLGDKGVYSTDTDTLFVVKDHDGNVVFVVFPDGAQIIVDETVKGKVGGFAVSGRNPNKAESLDIFKVTPDSTRVFVNETAKGKVGGFAVSGRNPNKSVRDNYLVITSDSTRIYVQDSVAGFGVANIEGGIAENFLNLNKQNYLIGHQTGGNTSTGKYNSMIGYQSGYTNSSGSNNIFFGYKSGYLNVTGGNNVFIGTESGYVNQFTFQNTYVGYRSGYDLSGSGNTVMGSMAGENAGGGNNTFIGTSAGRIATGGNNTFLGNGAGYSFPNENTGVRNTYIGQAVGSFTSTGEHNVMLGFNSGYLNYEGSYNTFLGYNTGRDIHEGSGNVFIGYEAGKSQDGVSDQLFISNWDDLSPLIYGNFSLDRLSFNGNVGVNRDPYSSVSLTVSPAGLAYGIYVDAGSTNYAAYFNGSAYVTGIWSTSDKRWKKNIKIITRPLEKILTLKGVTFEWDIDKYPDKGFNDKSQIGFIAQELEQVFPELVKEDQEGYKSVAYDKISPIIIEAMKEQQAQIEKQKEDIDELKKQINELKELVNQLMSK